MADLGMGLKLLKTGQTPGAGAALIALFEGVDARKTVSGSKK